MVTYAPALLSLALNLDGIHIFKEPRATSTGPYLSCFIFMIAVFVLLTHFNGYPYYFRKVWWWGNIILQFIYAQLMFEYLLTDVWFPVEEGLSSMVQSSVETLDQWEQMEPFRNILEALKSETIAIICSYLLSSFFLLASLHASKVIDLRILDCGMSPFMQDIYERIEDFLARFLRSFNTTKTCGKPKKCKSKSKCAEFPTTSRKKKPYDDSADDDSSNWNWHPPKKFTKRHH